MADVLNGSEKNSVIYAFKPQLLVQAPKAADAVKFYKAAFGAEEVNVAMHPKRKAEQETPLVLSADLKLGSAVFSVKDLPEDASQVKTEGAGCVFWLETEDLDGAIAKAVSAGAVADGEVTEGEVGGRVGKVKDPFGYVWAISCLASEKPADEEA